MEQRGAEFAECYYREQREIDDDLDVCFLSFLSRQSFTVLDSSYAAGAMVDEADPTAATGTI